MFYKNMFVNKKLLSEFLICMLILTTIVNFISIPVESVTLSPMSPFADDFINGTYNFTVGESDLDASYVEFWIDNVFYAYMRPTGLGSWYFELNTIGLADGVHYVQYRGYGPTNDTIAFAVFVDNYGPELMDFEVIYPHPQEAARWNDFVMFQIDAEDEFGVGMVMVNCSTINFTTPVGPMFDDGFHQDEAPNDGFYGSDLFMVDSFATGTFVINVSAWDINGNFNSESYIIEIDNMPPMVIETNITYPPGQVAAKYGDQIRVTARSFDMGMGMTGGILGLAANLTSINGSLNELMYDDGLHGDDFDGDGMYGTDWVTVGSYNNGFNIIGCNAYDIALNSGLNFALVNTDNNAPTVIRIKIKYPNGQGYALDGDRINVSATIIDDQGPGAITRYYLDASEIGGPHLMGNTSAFRWDNIEVSAGYTRSRGSTDITVHVFDHAGNEGTLSAHVEVGQDIRRTPTITVTSPNGGENWMDGDYYPITWIADGNLGNRPIDLFYSTDNGESWKPIAMGIPNYGFYNWTVPTEETAGGLIGINVTDIYNNTISDTSDASFSIDPPPPSWPKQSVNNGGIINDDPNPLEPQKEIIGDSTEGDKEILDDTKTNHEKTGSSSNAGNNDGYAIGIIALFIFFMISIATNFYLLKTRKKPKNEKTEHTTKVNNKRSISSINNFKRPSRRR